MGSTSKTTFDDLTGQNILKKFTHAILVLNMDKGFHGESDESRFRMQVRASLGFAAFVLARRKLPAVERYDLPIIGHALQLYRCLHQNLCQQ